MERVFFSLSPFRLFKVLAGTWAQCLMDVTPAAIVSEGFCANVARNPPDKGARYREKTSNLSKKCSFGKKEETMGKQKIGWC